MVIGSLFCSICTSLHYPKTLVRYFFIRLPKAWFLHSSLLLAPYRFITFILQWNWTNKVLSSTNIHVVCLKHTYRKVLHPYFPRAINKAWLTISLESPGVRGRRWHVVRGVVAGRIVVMKFARTRIKCENEQNEQKRRQDGKLSKEVFDSGWNRNF